MGTLLFPGNWKQTDEVAAATIETPLGKVPPDIYDICACHAAMWRIRAENLLLTDYVFTCWLEAASNREGSSCGGEWLQAQQWSGGTITVIVGTQDEEAVALVPGQVPDRWLDMVSSGPGTPEYVEYVGGAFVEYGSAGFVLRPPDLESGELAQFQFVVAWAEEEKRHEAWFAVNRSPVGILDDLNTTSPG